MAMPIWLKFSMVTVALALLLLANQVALRVGGALEVGLGKPHNDSPVDEEGIQLEASGPGCLYQSGGTAKILRVVRQCIHRLTRHGPSNIGHICNPAETLNPMQPHRQHQVRHAAAQESPHRHD